MLPRRRSGAHSDSPSHPPAQCRWRHLRQLRPVRQRSGHVDPRCHWKCGCPHSASPAQACTSRPAQASKGTPCCSTSTSPALEQRAPAKPAPAKSQPGRRCRAAAPATPAPPASKDGSLHATLATSQADHQSTRAAPANPAPRACSIECRERQEISGGPAAGVTSGAAECQSLARVEQIGLAQSRQAEDDQRVRGRAPPDGAGPAEQDVAPEPQEEGAHASPHDRRSEEAPGRACAVHLPRQADQTE
mmetsp:Transcript_75027/g.232746  ORF Transcript_75027/g.232746 Transcript_75027/m.232746 type:complete len:247 (+) Transcript_75027:223-963(+)